MIIAVINNKGGTGKTTTSVNLAGAFASLGYDILVVDLDPQASASISLGSTMNMLLPSVANVLFDGIQTESAIRKTSTPGIDLLTADPELIHTDLTVADVPGRDGLLKSALSEVREDYDFIICDCPPSFSMVSVNALVAADAYVIPVTPDYLALEDLGCMMGIVNDLRNKTDIGAELLGIVVTMTPNIPSFLSSNARLARNNIGELRHHFGDDVFTTEIKMDSKLADAPAYGTTVFGAAPSSQGAKQYMALAEELIERHRIIKRKTRERRKTQPTGPVLKIASMKRRQITLPPI